MTGHIWESVIQCQDRAGQCPQIFLFPSVPILPHTLTAVEMDPAFFLHVLDCLTIILST